MSRRPPTRRAPQGARLKRSFHEPVSQIGRFENREDGATLGAMSAIFLVTSQTVLITALLYYFGWVRTQANFGYFGVDTSLLGFTTTDYVLRSINSAFPPLIGLALITLLVLGGHRWALARAVAAPINTSAGRILTTFVSLAPWIGAALAAVVLTGVAFPEKIGRPLGAALPLILVSAVGVLGYSEHIRSLRPVALRKKQEIGSGSSQIRTRAAALVAIIILGILWWISLYAAQVGRREALDSAATLLTSPAIMIYSSERIALAGPGVVVDEIQQTGSKYHYRYSGLRLLVQTRDRYILVPVGWRAGRESVLLVPVGDTMRLDTIS